MSEGPGKPEKISLDDVLKGGGGSGPPDEEDGIIEIIPQTETPGGGAQDVPAPAGGAGASTAAEEPHAAAASRTEELLKEALAEKEQLQDLYLRARADLENFRKRVEREREEDRARAGAALLREMLPALDDLDRALAQPPEATGFREGVDLIRRRLDESLRKLGMEAIETLGETFDPSRHEALAVEPREGFAPNTIIEEIRRGYFFMGRVLRPSMVKVAVAAPGRAEEPVGAQGESDGTDHRD